VGRIAVLPPEVAARIAAGEVVERPASVVKELCDNALDAGARRVRVELEEGGLRAVVVVDDGVGMDPEDAVLAFRRHATSKIRRFEDLQSLSTLGFRGEALPSIAAVARVRLTTRPADRPEGTSVEVAGPSEPEARPAAAAPGTRVEVRDLFFNTPARRAVLRGSAHERALVLEVVTGLALARPDVAFEVVEGRRELLATPGEGGLLGAAVALWGPELVRQLLPVHAEEQGWEVRGLCGPPAVSRGHRGLQFLSVDGRPVRSEAVRGAVESAYQGLLMTRRFPVFVLALVARAPGLYDPNVHPSKREVRWVREDAVRDLCRRAVRAALRGAELIPEARARSAAAEEPRPSPAPRPWGAAVRFALQAQAAPSVPREEAAALAPQGSLPALRPLGQLAQAYLVAEGPDGLYLVDQHAAHERVWYERLAGRQSPCRPLAVPLPVVLTPDRLRRVETRAEALVAAGYTVEPFGEAAVLLRAVPDLPGDPVDGFLGFLDRLGDGRAGEEDGDVRRALVACRSAIRAGAPLGAEDAAALLDALGRCAEPFTCPHGRPTVVRLGLDELERLFRRR
jgi:DNA mismatch repair protein MutL